MPQHLRQRYAGMLLGAIGALAACGRVTENSAAGAVGDSGEGGTGSVGMSATDSGGAGGEAGSGGAVGATTAGGAGAGAGTASGSGGAQDPSADPCEVVEIAPGDLCLVTPCGISRALEISCDRTAPAVSVALTESTSYAAFTAELKDATHALALIEWRANNVSLATLPDVDGGRVLQGSEGIARLATVGREYYWIGADSQLGEHIELGESPVVVDLLLDDAGVVQFLTRAPVEGSPWVILGSDGSRQRVLGDFEHGWLVAGEPVSALLGQATISVTSGLGELNLTYADSGTSEPSFVIPIDAADSMGMLRAARYARSVAVDFANSTGLYPSPARNMSMLYYLSGSGRSLVYDAQLLDMPCGATTTVPFPDICPTDTTSQMRGVGAPQGAFALADTPGGEVWLAVLEGPLTSECKSTTLSGCFETLPCQCAEVLSHSFDLSLNLYRAPDFENPVLLANVPGSASEVSLEMASLGQRLSILVLQRGGSSTGWWLEVDTQSL